MPSRGAAASSAPASSSFARRRARRIAALTSRLLSQLLPPAALAEAENERTAQAFCLGHFQHHRFASPDTARARRRLAGIAENLALKGHAARASALLLLTRRVLSLPLRPEDSAGDARGSRSSLRREDEGEAEGAGAALLLLLALAGRPAAAAERDVAALCATGEVDAQRERWQRLLGVDVVSGHRLPPQWQPFREDGPDAANRSWTREADDGDGGDDDALSEWSDDGGGESGAAGEEEEEEEDAGAVPAVHRMAQGEADARSDGAAVAEARDGGGMAVAAAAAAALAAASQAEALLLATVAPAFSRVTLQATPGNRGAAAAVRCSFSAASVAARPDLDCPSVCIRSPLAVESPWQMQLAAEPYAALGTAPTVLTLSGTAALAVVAEGPRWAPLILCSLFPFRGGAGSRGPLSPAGNGKSGDFCREHR